MKKLGLGLVPYFPLAGGSLSGKYRKGAALPEGSRHSGGSARFLDPHWETIEALHKFADVARPHPARTRDELARLQADGFVDHRRRHQGRAGGGERQVGRLEADTGGDGRGGQAHRVLTPVKAGDGALWHGEVRPPTYRSEQRI